jgi:hypothetical protein
MPESPLTRKLSAFVALSETDLEELVTFQKHRVVFDDFDRLSELAGFDTGYLDQDGPLLR